MRNNLEYASAICGLYYLENGERPAIEDVDEMADEYCDVWPGRNECNREKFIGQYRTFVLPMLSITEFTLVPPERICG
jgi:hypothetical protein